MGRRSARVAAGVTVLLAALVPLGACGDGDGDGATPSPSASASPPTPTAPTAPTGPTSPAAPTASTSPSVPLPALRGVPVYYVGESQRSLRLFREFRTVDDAGTPVLSAVRAVTGLAPLDPDYLSPWRPASRLSVGQTGSTLTIDLSADAWGVVRIGRPMSRAPMADVQAHAWVTSPQEGEVRRAGDVAFTGFGTSFEATFGWVVRSAAGSVVARGSAMGGTGTGGFGSVRFTARLSPGSYTVTLSTDDPSGGAEGRGPATDDKRFTVR